MIEIVEGFVNSAEREHPVDNRHDLLVRHGGQQRTEFVVCAQCTAEDLKLADEYALQISFRMRSRSRATSHNPPSAADGSEARRPSRLADIVDNDVNAAPVGKPQDRLQHIITAVVDGCIGSDLESSLHFPSTAGSYDRPSASKLRHLQGSKRYAAPDAVDQHCVGRSDTSLCHHHAPSCKVGTGKNRGGLEVDGRGHCEQHCGVDAYELRKCSVNVLAKDFAAQAKHLLTSAAIFAMPAGFGRVYNHAIARAPFGDARPQSIDKTCAIDSKNQRQLVRDALSRPSHIEVYVIEGCYLNAHTDLVFCRRGLWLLADLD
jgi:hypothetical protein